jgi:hypothetical protein
MYHALYGHNRAEITYTAGLANPSVTHVGVLYYVGAWFEFAAVLLAAALPGH